MAGCGAWQRVSSQDSSRWELVMDAEARSLICVPSLYHGLAVSATGVGMLTGQKHGLLLKRIDAVAVVDIVDWATVMQAWNVDLMYGWLTVPLA